MLKLVTKRGSINYLSKHESVIYFKIDAFDFECIRQFKDEDLAENDEVIIVGYLTDDEDEDQIFYVSAFFNISKNYMSKTKGEISYVLGGFIIFVLFALLSWKIIMEKYPLLMSLLILIFLLMAFLSVFLVNTLMAYRILEKEIKKLP